MSEGLKGTEKIRKKKFENLWNTEPGIVAESAENCVKFVYLNCAILWSHKSVENF